YRGFYEEPRFRPSYLLRQRQAAGLLGRKSGRGFYAYDGADRLERPDTAPLPRGAQRPVWVSAAQPHWHSALSALLQRSGWEADGGERPAADSLCLVTPLGDDTTTAALAEGLDP